MADKTSAHTPLPPDPEALRAPVEIIDPVRFLQATRDSGYRHLDSAVAELIDNSLQSGARRIRITTPASLPGTEPCLAVLDDGTGMEPAELARALQFGGSDRFDDRSGLGRYGMGLPNSSLSQARAVEVYSWRDRRDVWRGDLDMDALLAPAARSSPRYLRAPARAPLPDAFRRCRFRSGTLVVWRKLDRAQRGAARWDAAARRLAAFLGQAFRYFLWQGRSITVDGAPVRPSDPLFLAGAPPAPGTAYGDVLRFPVRLGEAQNCSHSLSAAGRVPEATVEVRFSELPVRSLYHLSNAEKRAMGITNRAGVSVVRAGREIDYGWFLMDKRRENYDDWWRCEIRFPPVLDEMFGVTHTKQGIRPSEHLRRMLTPELSAIARTLNRRVRTVHAEIGAERERTAAARTAAARDQYLRPVRRASGPAPERAEPAWREGGGRRYRIALDAAWERDFCRVDARDDEVVLILNTHHEFYRTLYAPLADGTCDDARALRYGLELFLIAFGRSTLLDWNDQERAAIEAFVGQWSRAAAVFGRPAPGGTG